MTHLDLFSGIGGFSLAAQWVWGESHSIVAFIEKDKFCQQVLSKHWPDVPIHDCIKDYNHDGRSIDLLTGGFPCQPFSVAGRKKGTKDDRDLWPEMFRVIQQAKPTWIIGENVANFTNMAFTRTKVNLESEGYTVQPFIIPACAVGAKHRRDRAWIVAYSLNSSNKPIKRQERKKESVQSTNKQKGCSGMFIRASSSQGILADTRLSGLQRYRKLSESIRTEAKALRQCSNGSNKRTWKRWPVEPDICRVANGIPRRVDRLKSLGNAIVPQVAQVIMEAIKYGKL